MSHARGLGQEKPCECCGILFKPRRDSLAKGQGRFCSIGCANSSRSKNPAKLTKQEMSNLYLLDRLTIDQIAKKIGSNRKSVRRKITEYEIPMRCGGPRPKNGSLQQTTYRSVAKKNIGRPLKRGETVHHVDLDPLNNNPKNLAVLPSRKEHNRVHRQLEAMAGMLVRSGLIEWRDGLYIFSGRMEEVLKYAERQ
jgi:hypothetical protein